MKTRKEKKSESLEVRLPHSKKQAFMEACEREGITASQAVRTFIDVYVRRSRRTKLKTICQDLAMKLIRNPFKTAGISIATLAGALAFTATPSIADEDAFTRLDSNSDGYITEADEPAGSVLLKHLGHMDTDEDSRISRAEFAESTKDGKITIRTMSFNGDDEDGVKTGVFIGEGNTSIEALLDDEDAEISGHKVVIMKTDGDAEDIDVDSLLDWSEEDGDRKIIVKRIETDGESDVQQFVEVIDEKVIIKRLGEDGEEMTFDLEDLESGENVWTSEDGETRVIVRKRVKKEETEE